MYIDIEEDTRKFRISNLEYVFELNIGTGGGRIHACIQGGQVKKVGTAAGQLDSWTDIRFQVERSRVERIASWSKDNCTLR